VHHLKYEAHNATALIICTEVLKMCLLNVTNRFVSARVFPWLNTSFSTESTFWTTRILRFLPLSCLQSTVGPYWFDEALSATYSQMADTSFCSQTRWHFFLNLASITFFLTENVITTIVFLLKPLFNVYTTVTSLTCQWRHSRHPWSAVCTDV